MKIGIITLPPAANYGGILQAYAMSKVLQGIGHDAQVICTPSTWRVKWYKFPLSLSKRMVQKYLLRRKDTVVFRERKFNREFPTVSQYTLAFVEKYVPHVTVRRYEDIREGDFDAFVVGSDQIWRPVYFLYPIEDAFLRFASGWKVKRIAYAASFGVDFWEYSARHTKACKRLAAQFDAISVRERSGVDLCSKYLSSKAQWVLDPTMLLKAEDYIQLFENSHTPKSSGNLLCYILDESEEKQAIISHIAHQHSLLPFRVNSKAENLAAPLQNRIQPTVEQWLRGFYDAEFVVTDSFHACAFSIIFRRQFVVIANPGRGNTRMQSLLSMFGLDDRLVNNLDDVKELPTIDYQMVYQKYGEWACP